MLQLRRFLRSRLFYLMHLSIYVDTRDWWVGYYRASDYHYVCLLPAVVIRWRRGPA